MTELIAHRGAHDIFTENTIEAFSRALEIGFRAIEFDVHVTADDVPVVYHDPTVPGSGTLALVIRRTSSAALRASAPWIPRLDETLDLLAGRAVAYVEVKCRGGEGAIAGVLRGSRADRAVHSFQHAVPGRIASLVPGLRTGILQSSRLVDTVSALRAAGATDLWQWHDQIDAELVSEVSAAGCETIAWTSNTPSDWRVFKDLGVTGICTDLRPPPVVF